MKSRTRKSNSGAASSCRASFFKNGNNEEFLTVSQPKSTPSLQAKYNKISSLGHQRIQRDPPQGASQPAASPDSTSSGAGRSRFNPIADLLRSQLSDASLRRHLRSLGTALQGLAVDGTTGERSRSRTDRLVALQVARTFSSSASQILQDRALRQIRTAVLRISENNPEVILAGALAALIAAGNLGLEIPISASPEIEPGHGVSVGGDIDLGTVQEPQFRRIRIAAGVAQRYFEARVSSEVIRQEGEDEGAEPETVARAQGQLRIGSQSSNLSGQVQFDSQGRLMLQGSFAVDPLEGSAIGRRRSGPRRFSLQFSTALRYQRDEAGEEVFTIRPGMRGDFRIDAHQRLRIGASAIIRPGQGFDGLSGSVEFQHRRIRLRIEGNLEGIPDRQSIAPGRDMRIQGTIGVAF